MSGTFRSRRDREEEARRSEANAKKAASRELNPNLRSDSNKDTNPHRSSTGSAVWLKKAFRRAQERAEAEGRPLEDIARERWGSLDTYYELLREAEGDDHRDDRSRSRRTPSPRRERKGFSRPREEWEERDYDSGSRRRSSHHHERRHHSSSSWKTRERRERDDARKESPPNHIIKPSINEKESSFQQKEPSSNTEESSIHTPSIEPPSSDKPEKVLSEKELNALGAKIIKAEILGNTELANKLKAKLEKAKAHALSAPSKGTKEEEVVILTKTDAHGNERPLTSEELLDSSHHDRRKKKKKPNTHDSDGQRSQYFADDNQRDLKALFVQEKSGGSDENQGFSRLARKHERLHEDFDMDDLFVSQAASAKSSRDVEKEKDRAIAQHVNMSKSLESCRFCYNSSAFGKHLVISSGKKVALILPHNAPLTPGHCLIVPLSHVSCGTLLDEDVLEEMKAFKSALMSMFREEYEGSEVVFFETVLGLKRFPHMRIEAVPIPNDPELASASIYFQKAISECETEWSLNKKLIQLGSKGLKRSVPKGLPYFHVDFGLENGFAHVIEDEELFPANFGHEIIGGMLDLDHRRWKSRKSEGFEEQRARVLEFGAKWHKYDCTKF